MQHMDPFYLFHVIVPFCFTVSGPITYHYIRIVGITSTCVLKLFIGNLGAFYSTTNLHLLVCEFIVLCFTNIESTYRQHNTGQTSQIWSPSLQYFTDSLSFFSRGSSFLSVPLSLCFKGSIHCPWCFCSQNAFPPLKGMKWIVPVKLLLSSRYHL